MLLPYPNPVISAMVLSDDMLVENFKECRQIHRDIQAGEGNYPDAQRWEDHLVYLMLIGDCMSRELTRRGLGELHQVNLILQHPRNMYPAYWKNIVAPTLEKVDVSSMGEYETWGPDVYPEELPDVEDTVDPMYEQNRRDAEAEQEQVDGAQ